MRPDVHQAALKAAAKVAFSVVFLNGCGGSVEQPAPSGSRPGPAEAAGGKAPATASNEPGVATSTQPSHATESPATPGVDDAGVDSASSQPQTCNALLAATFPTPSDYKWTPEPRSKEVVACCLYVLTNEQAPTPYHWDCCVAYDPDSSSTPLNQNPATRIACTPWGPPVPPSMTRSRRPTPQIAAWIAQAVA